MVNFEIASETVSRKFSNSRLSPIEEGIFLFLFVNFKNKFLFFLNKKGLTVTEEEGNPLSSAESRKNKTNHVKVEETIYSGKNDVELKGKN